MAESVTYLRLELDLQHPDCAAPLSRKDGSCEGKGRRVNFAVGNSGRNLAILTNCGACFHFSVNNYVNLESLQEP